MSIVNKIKSMANLPGSYEEKLYIILSDAHYKERPYELCNLDENMAVLKQVISGWWKPRYLLNHGTRCAYEFMDPYERLVAVDESDIKWETLKNLPEEYLERVRSRNAMFPSFIMKFQHGVAEVQWQLNPDGRYWMDEDGYGMTPDEEYNIYGFIDSQCRIVMPYQAVKDVADLETLRKQAENIVKGQI